MLETPGGVLYPGPTEPYPEAEWWKKHAESIDEALVTSGAVRLDRKVQSGTPVFGDIIQDLDHLAVVWYGHHTGGGDHVTIQVRFNADSGTNYHSQRFGISNGAFVNVAGVSSHTTLRLGLVGNAWSGGLILIPGYTSSTRKIAQGRGHSRTGAGETNAGNILTFGGGHWTGTAPVTSVRVGATGEVFTAGSTFSLYGW